MSVLHQVMSVDQPSNHATPFSLGLQPTTVSGAPSDTVEALSSHEDGIKKSLLIDMKDLVGDAVGNVCPMCLVHSFTHPKVDEHQSFIP
jgi:hypothetical protein